MIDYYKILNVSQDASLDEIKKAYRKLVKKYHPDNYAGSEKEALEHMSELNVAYNVLTEETKRFLYNQKYKQMDIHKNSTSDKNTASDNSTPPKETFSSKENFDFHEQPYSSKKDLDFQEESSSAATCKTGSQKGCLSGCFGKLINYCIFLVVVLFLVKHFNLLDKFELLKNKSEILLNIDKGDTDKSPESCINSYFNALREKDINTANTLFKDSSYREYTKTITDIYQSIRKDDRYYQLFKEIPNFTIHSDAINYNTDKTKAEISVTIQNINCYEFMAFLFTSFDSDSVLESLSQEELDLAISDMLQNKATYLTASVCIFEMERMDGLWKISKIDDVNIMISVLIGKVDLLAKATDNDE